MKLQQAPIEFLKGLKKLCDDHNVFLVFNETASKEFSYSDNTYFLSCDDKLIPDAGFSFLGGQAAIVFLREELFISKPLMMISTWDGDEHAFASFHKGMREILNNKEDFLKTRSQFNTKVTDDFKHLQLQHFQINKGRGYFMGPVPNSIAKLFTTKMGMKVIDPTYSAMKNYINRKEN